MLGLLMIPLFEKKLDIPGFNACIIQNDNGYMGLTRVCNYHSQKGVYPEATNKIFIFFLNNDFETMGSYELEDKTNRTLYKNWTQGIEDPRLLSPNTFTAVTCDTNDRWKTEMSLVTFDLESRIITNILPLFMNGTQHLTQKNWLYLKKYSDDLSDYLYSSFPFTVIRVNSTTGQGYILKEVNTPDTNIVSHNGAILKINDTYLLTVRVKSGHDYHYSLWVKLSSDYDLIGVSKPFRFLNDEHINQDGTFKAAGYEMCMSLHLENNELIVCVSVEDRDIYIQKYDLDDIEQMFN